MNQTLNYRDTDMKHTKPNTNSTEAGAAPAPTILHKSHMTTKVLRTPDPAAHDAVVATLQSLGWEVQNA